jgi:sugar diacid utilization regulator
MEERFSGAWTAVTTDLETAALLPDRRDEIIQRALQQLLTSLPVMGTALIWPGRKSSATWKVYYAGHKRAAMQRWLSARLDPSPDVTVGMLQQDLTRDLLDLPPPLLIRLNPALAAQGGIWLIWSAPAAAAHQSDALNAWIEPVRQTLETVLEVEEREEHYFSNSSPLSDRELIQALAHGDNQALAAYLSLTRIVAQANLTFWGRVYQDVVEVTSHLGAQQTGFGFVLPRGQGVGGRVAVSGTTIAIGDYRNSPLRDPSVSDTVDREQVRAGMAVPVFYSMMPEGRGPVTGILYATRRVDIPFSRGEQLLVQRLARRLEPIPQEERPRLFGRPAVQPLPAQKAAWHDLVLHATHIEAVEAWAAQLIQGTVIITDSDGKPYVLAHSDQIEQLNAARLNQPDQVQVLSLAAPGVSLPGQVYLCPSLPLPSPHWPDFYEDLIVACNVVIARLEQAQDHLARQREHWLRMLLQGKALQGLEQDGYRLGLPVEQGQLCVLAWPQGTMQSLKSVRQRLTAERVVLNILKSQLTFCEDDLAVVLLAGQAAPQSPSKVRDALLKHCSPRPLWLIHGGLYRSLSELQTTLLQALALARKARREGSGEYVLDIHTCGLDSLLEHPRLAEELEVFARKTLTPLLEYDAATGSHLTETFVLAQTLGSAQAVAEHLEVHVNTIRYRLHRAEDLLGVIPASPKEQTALALAAFTWQRYHMAEQLPL